MQRQIVLHRLELRQVLVAEWRERLQRPTAGFNIIEAIRPVLVDWLGRIHGSLSFHVTQLLSVHGCFGKEPDTRCHHCVHYEEDSAQHTLVECVAWYEQRRTLKSEVGEDLSPPIVVQKMIRSAESWDAVVSFCEDVMSQKEAAERDRQAHRASKESKNCSLSTPLNGSGDGGLGEVPVTPL
uniref:SFRICE_033471 n=1 Tax=Spodoptera frugiperda TaxID=7108 RepID=A0A2H1W776_SPOFR